MIELTNAEALSLAALLIKVGRPHAPDEARDMDLWVTRLSRGRPIDTHGADLLA